MATRLLLVLPGVLVILVFVLWRVTMAARNRNPFPPGLPGDSPASTGLRWTVTNVANKLDVVMKCGCGYEQRFHADPEPDPQNLGSTVSPTSDPAPPGDSWSCPQCGTTHDLSELHKVIRRSLHLSS